MAHPGLPQGNQFEMADAPGGGGGVLEGSAGCKTAALTFWPQLSLFSLPSSVRCSLNWSHLNYLLFHFEVKHFMMLLRNNV